MGNVENMHKTAAALATELTTTTGDAWAYVAHGRGYHPEDGLSNWCELHRADGLVLAVANKTNNGKPRIRIWQSSNCEAWRDNDGDVMDPRDYIPGGGREEFPAITVAAIKSAAVITRDICKRIMPDADRLHVAGVVQCADWNSSHAKRDANSEAMGCRPSHNGRTNPSRYLPRDTTPAGVGRVEIEAGSGGVDLKIDGLTIKKAQAVLKALGITVTK